jgi:NAD(P)-dependent dehydrogenase (short-subunit alcohol dehydrogenase family)
MGDLMNVLITGVSKGIGLELTTEALRRGHHVFGVARHPEESKELMQLQKKYKTLTIIALDLANDDAQKKLGNDLKTTDKIDILINNAGILENASTKEAFMKSYELNAYVPFMVVETILPKLKTASNPKIVHITSMMGSIEDNTSGGYYAYRSSKSALNMIHKSLTVDHDWLISAVIHPGWVQTRMGGESAPTTVEVSANGIWKVVEGLTAAETGCFKDYQGKNLPW